MKIKVMSIKGKGSLPDELTITVIDTTHVPWKKSVTSGI